MNKKYIQLVKYEQDKKIKEAAFNYLANCHYNGESTSSDVESAFKAGAEFAQRWISIEEELPDIDDGAKILVRSRRGGIYLSYYFKSKGFTSNANITHWRHI